MQSAIYYIKKFLYKWANEGFSTGEKSINLGLGTLLLIIHVDVNNFVDKTS
jgi:hypothetical protein